MSEIDILICGAGPTGLGAAWRLEELRRQGLGDRRWRLVDKEIGPGGMATSIHRQGFTWDLGGHVLFPHYPYFDAILDDLVADWCEVVPVRGAWMRGRFVPYPVQQNLRHLPVDERETCLADLARLPQPPTGQGVTFEDHLLASFGAGLYRSFFEPLNVKMWATHPRAMSHDWASIRSGSAVQNVPSVDLDRIRTNIVEERDDLAWDDTTRIRYPSHGGTGVIWDNLAARLPADRICYRTEVVSIDGENRVATLGDGTTIGYRTMLSSMPIDRLLTLLPRRPDLAALAAAFQPCGVDLVGVGVTGTAPDALRSVCSLYIPEPQWPFWRVTVLSNYSPHVSPPGTWSLLCEVNSSRSRPRPEGDLVELVITGLIELGFVPHADAVCSRWSRSQTHGYPVPVTGRNEVLQAAQTELAAMGIVSRGRFGGWKYEVCNQDHSFMQGVEAVDRLVLGADEITYPTPHAI